MAPTIVQAENTRAAALRVARSFRKHTTGLKFKVKDRGVRYAKTKYGRFAVIMTKARKSKR